MLCDHGAMAGSSPRFAWFGGRRIPFGEARVPIEDRGLQFGESLYEVVPVVAGQPRLLAEHHRRMVRGAEVLGLAHGLPELARWREIAAQLVAGEKLAEGVLYLQLTGGCGAREHAPDPRPAPFFFAYLRNHRFPRAEDFERGLRIVTCTDERWARCDLKTTQLLPAVWAKREARRRGADEALWVGADGEVREGSSWNVLVVEGDRLRTPALGPGLLAGITRTVALELARDLVATVEEATLSGSELLAADEVLLASTTRGCLAVTEVDDRPIGAGAPGKIGRRLARGLRLRLGLGS